MVKARIRLAALLALVSGVLLLISGISGAGTWRSLRVGLENYVALPPNVELALQIIIVLGALGGLTVLAAAYLLWKGLKRTGRLLVTIGVGIGLIGLTLAILLALVNGSLESFLSPSTGLVGIVLSIVARMLAK
ncbi:MAG TPA: hypothetical protein EYP43_04010 [Thermoplasmata archaeon]|nr:hypothetical protein [Thermoplasmata archaeon]